MRLRRNVLLLAGSAAFAVAGCLEPGPSRKAGVEPPAAAEVRLAAAPAVRKSGSARREASAPGPLDLQDLQALVRSRNPSVRRWRERLAAFEARVRRAESGFFPRLRTTGSYLRLEEEIALEDPLGNRFIVQDLEAYTQTTQLSYALLDWGRTRYLRRASAENLEAEKAKSRRALQELDRLAARTYYGLHAARAELAALRRSVDALEESLRVARELEAVGRATRADVLIVEARLERRRFDLRTLEDSIRDLEDELLELLDLPPETPFELLPPSGAGAALELLPPSSADTALELLPPSGAGPGERGEGGAGRLEEWEALALARRPELEAAREAYAALLSTRRAEKGALLPQLEVFFEHEYSTTESAFRDPNRFSGGFTLVWDVFDGGLRNARVAELDALAREAAESLHGLEAAVRTEVRRAWRAYERARRAVEVARVTVANARENHRRVMERFREGRATGQEVLEAEALLRVEEAGEARARYELLDARAELRFRAGLDPWEALEPVDPPNADRGGRGGAG